MYETRTNEERGYELEREQGGFIWNGLEGVKGRGNYVIILSSQTFLNVQLAYD